MSLKEKIEPVLAEMITHRDRLNVAIKAMQELIGQPTNHAIDIRKALERLHAPEKREAKPGREWRPAYPLHRPKT